MRSPENDAARQEDRAESGSHAGVGIVPSETARIVESGVVDELLILAVQLDDGRRVRYLCDLRTLGGKCRLDAVCRATGVDRPNDSKMLHGIPFLATVRRGHIVAMGRLDREVPR